MGPKTPFSEYSPTLLLLYEIPNTVLMIIESKIPALIQNSQENKLKKSEIWGSESKNPPFFKKADPQNQ